MHNTYHHISFKKKWTLSEDLTFQLGELQGYIKAVTNVPIRPDYRKRLMQISLTRGSLATTAIEGNTLNIEEVEAIERGKHLAPSLRYLEVEVSNVLKALNSILDQTMNNEKKNAITPKLILSFHEMIGRGIGDNFAATPGQFRKNNVTVGQYRAPNHKEVPDMIEKLCKWLKNDFPIEGKFSTTIIQAIVVHVYIAWIHPFSDGNGRTARLLEFYLLLCAGVPDIAAHVLSDYYNRTRSGYYRQIQIACEKCNLSGFIEYAVTGLRDGLESTLNQIQENQLEITWNNFIANLFEKEEVANSAVNKRRSLLMLAIPHNKLLTLDELRILNTKVEQSYRNLGQRTLYRDVEDLCNLDLLVKENKKYRAKVEVLKQFQALQK